MKALLSLLIVTNSFANIFGPDTREPYSDPRVGRMARTPCTSFLISDRCALSAGHCFRGVNENFIFHKTLVHARNLGFQNKKDNDWSVYLLSKPLRQFGYYSVRRVRNNTPLNLHIIGFPTDHQQSMISHDPVAYGGRLFYIFHRAPTQTGNSGSPVVDHDTGDVIGIHVRGERDYNVATSFHNPELLSAINHCMKL